MNINILQWNVWYREDIDKVIDVIKDLDVDIACLQELTHGYIGQSQDNTWEYIQHELGFDRVHQSIPIITESEQWLQGNAIFSRFELGEPRRHWLHEPVDEEDRADLYRGYLEVDVHIAKMAITVATTHMSFQQYEEGSDFELQKLLDLTNSKLGRYILTGDFNVTPDSPRIQALASRFNHAGPDYSENTWTTKPHITPDFEATELDRRYDFVFASDDIKVVGSRIVGTEVSDHLPILVTIEVPDN